MNSLVYYDRVGKKKITKRKYGMEKWLQIRDNY